MARAATPRQTAIAEALTAAGYQHARERLNALADQICARTDFRTRDAMVQAVIVAIINDPALLWALFEPYSNSAIGRLLEEAILRRTAQRGRQQAAGGARGRANGSPAPAPAPVGGTQAAGFTAAERRASRDATNAVVARVISKLDTFKVNNRPIGDCTPEEVMAWHGSRTRDNRFAWLLANSGVPHGQPIRSHITPEESEAFYAQAQEFASNA